jgi:hypothetical protein
MRTKTLLIAATALAITALSSSAQTYSQNIVGYTTTVLQSGFNLVCPTVSVSPSNTAQQVFTCLQAGDVLYIWNGGGFNSFTYLDVDTWINDNGDVVGPPTIALGAGLYYQAGSLETNTFTGTVVLSNSVALASGFNLVASTAPIGADLESTNLSLPLSAGDVAYLWNGGGFNSFTYLDVATWINDNGDVVGAPSLSVGAGFYYQAGSSGTWTQNVIVP